MDYWSHVFAVIDSLIAAYLYEAWKSSKKAPPNRNSLPSHINADCYEDSEVSDYDHRAANMERLKNFGKFLFTFYVLYSAIHLPLMIHSLGSVFYLDQARFVGRFLPHVAMTNDLFQAPSAIAAAILYLPLVYLALAGAHPVVCLIDNFRKTTYRTRFVATIIIFALLCFCVSVGVVYLFYDVTLQEDFVSIGVALFLTAGLSSSSGRR